MTEFVIRPPERPTVPIEGSSAVFPVRRIYCVGRNYAAHRAEMGGDDREPPFFFSKPADAIVPPGHHVPYPPATTNLHHEIELVVAIGPGATIFGYAAGVDLTRRDLQAQAKDKGYPWDAAKGFDCSAPISAIRRDIPPPSGHIRLSVNGEVRQDGLVSDMIWNIEEIIAEAGKLWRLEAGDLIFTGTPEGVGRLEHGDLVEGQVEGAGRLSFKIV